jgi:hypothetical protein
MVFIIRTTCVIAGVVINLGTMINEINYPKQRHRPGRAAVIAALQCHVYHPADIRRGHCERTGTTWRKEGVADSRYNGIRLFDLLTKTIAEKLKIQLAVKIRFCRPQAPMCLSFRAGLPICSNSSPDLNPCARLMA